MSRPSTTPCSGTSTMSVAAAGSRHSRSRRSTLRFGICAGKYAASRSGKWRAEPASTTRAYCGGIDLNFPLPKLLASVKSYLDRGFDAVKIKVCQPDLRVDITRIAAVEGFMEMGAAGG
jgi:hypothetical protein